MTTSQDFSKTAYFECHGTGTPVGDPIETGAVAKVFGESGIHITSVKPNVGHTEGASGLVSLIKAVMSLEHRTIPPNIKFNSPNPKIPFKEAKLTVPVEPTPFPTDRCERVSVNSFGLGGSNAHVIVDSARSFNIPEPVIRDSDREGDPQLLLFSAGSAPSLKSTIRAYENWISDNPDMAEKISDLSYTLANRREHLPHRSFKVVGANDTSGSQGRKIPGQPVSLVMVFTGQGAQWPRMGRELLLRDDLVFQRAIRTMDKYLADLDEAPQWTIEGELQKSAKTSRVQKAKLSQPLCTAVQVAMVDLLASIGIEPEAVVGHSSGELAGAYAAGALTAKEAIIGAYQRGQAAKLQNKKGAMAAVGLGWNEVEPFLNRPRVVIACENSPKSVTLSGDAEEVQATVDRIKEAHPDITARMLKVEKAYHSYHMQEIGSDYHAMIAPHLIGRQTIKPFFSSVTGTGEPEQRKLDAKYWQQNLESPVLFSPAVAGVLKHFKNPAFIEIGPHGALAGPARQIFAKASASPPYLSAMVRNEDCVQSYLAAVGKLFELNVPVNLEAVAPAGQTLPDLPRYPWHYEGEFWAESRMSAEWRNPKFPRHPLLGRRQLESTSLEPSWRNLINIEDAPWLRDHQVQGTIVFPAAGYFAIAGEAIRQLTEIKESYSLRHVVLSQALILQDGTDVEVVTNLRPLRLTDSEDSHWWEFSIASYNGNSWSKHCVGQVSAKPSARPAQTGEVKSLPRKLDTFKVFNTLAKAGMQYGPAFQRLNQISAGALETRAVSTLTNDLNGDEEKYHMHPTVIDAALQMGLVAARSGKLDASNCAAMPTLIEEVTIFNSVSETEMFVAASTIVQPGSGEIRGRFQVIANGKVLLDMPKAAFTSIQHGDKDVVHKLPITARISWKPHVDFVDVASLIKSKIDGEKWMPLLNELSELCFIFFQRCIEEVKVTENPSIQHFAAWIGRQYQTLDKNHPGHALNTEQIVDRAHQIGEIMTGTPLSACVDCILEVGMNIVALFTGDKTILEVLSQDDLLSRLYSAANTTNMEPFLKSLAHARPSLRILELGGSSGQFTTSLMKNLSLPNGGALYFKHTFTDPSSAILAEAKKSFQDLENIDFRLLDISMDPAEQGFKEDEKYDLIVATNYIHATPSLSGSLVNIRKLLAPGGRLLLQELSTESKFINCILGFLDEWWVGQDDGRIDEPYVSKERWELELERAGFAKPDMVLDSPAPYQTSAVIIARLEEDVNPAINKAVTILAYEHDGKNVEAVSQKLKSRGYTVGKCRLGEDLPQGSQNVISLLDEENPFFENIDEHRFQSLQSFVASIGDRGLFWITRPSQMQCTDPRYATVVGAIRSIRHEDTIDFATCEVADVVTSLDEVVDAFTHFQKGQEDDFFRPNYEYAIVDGMVNVPRFYTFTFNDERVSSRASEDQVSLVIGKPGRLATLGWESRRSEPLTGDQVDVEVYHAEISPKVRNFQLCAAYMARCTNIVHSQDLAEVMGNSPYPAGGLGVSASGRVYAIGPDVKNLAVGDRVIGLGSGSFSSYLRTSEMLIEKIPDNVLTEEAATLPAAFGTALAALHNVGNLRTGQVRSLFSCCPDKRETICRDMS